MVEGVGKGRVSEVRGERWWREWEKEGRVRRSGGRLLGGSGDMPAS